MSQSIDTGNGQQQSALGELQFSHIIGNPLSACVNAQKEAAQATLEYISEVVFRKNDDGSGSLEPVTLTFYYESSGVVNKLVVPLLCIIPVPYLQIEKVDLQFQASVTESSMNNNKLQLKAKYTTEDNSATATSSKTYLNRQCIDINLRVASADMPTGFARVIEIFNNQLVEVKSYEDETVYTPALQPANTPGAVSASTATTQTETLPADSNETDEDTPSASSQPSSTSQTTVPAEASAKYNIVLLGKISNSQKTVILNAFNTDRRLKRRLTAQELNNLLKATRKTLPTEVDEATAKAIVTALKKKNIAATIEKI